MDYTIIRHTTASGRVVPRVILDGRTYPLIVVGGVLLEDMQPRQRGHVLDGSYGDLPQAYARACADAGVPCRLNRGGVVDALLDYAYVSPPPFEAEA